MSEEEIAKCTLSLRNESSLRNDARLNLVGIQASIPETDGRGSGSIWMTACIRFRIDQFGFRCRGNLKKSQAGQGGAFPPILSAGARLCRSSRGRSTDPGLCGEKHTHAGRNTLRTEHASSVKGQHGTCERRGPEPSVSSTPSPKHTLLLEVHVCGINGRNTGGKSPHSLTAQLENC